MHDIPLPTDIRIIPDIIRIPNTTGTSTLSLHNHSSSGLAYKIKTNKPRDYIVEPAMGIIIPDQILKVNIKMTNEAEFFKDDHKLKIEIYKFDWRKTLEDFRIHVKDENVKCMERKIDVKFVRKDEMQRFDVSEKVCFGVLGVIFCHLLKTMFN